MARSLVAVGAVCSMLSVLGASLTARAHPLVEAGQRRYEEADFEGALEAFAQAEAGDDLLREELLELYYSRALVHFAMGSTEQLDADLARLVSVEPGYEPTAEPPPAIRERLDTVRRRIDDRVQLAVKIRPSPSGKRIVHEITGDVMRLVREVRTHGRVADGPWETAVDAPLELPVGPGTSASYYVEVIGPGGATLLSEGSRGEPRSLVGPAESTAAAADEGGGGSIVWWVVGGAVLLLGAGVTAYLLLTRDEPATQFDAPAVMRF